MTQVMQTLICQYINCDCFRVQMKAMVSLTEILLRQYRHVLTVDCATGMFDILLYPKLFHTWQYMAGTIKLGMKSFYEKDVE